MHLCQKCDSICLHSPNTEEDNNVNKKDEQGESQADVGGSELCGSTSVISSVFPGTASVQY